MQNMFLQDRQKPQAHHRRLLLLDAELNLDAKGGGQTEKIVAKSERPSILNKLKNTPARTTPGKPQKHHEEVR